MADQQDFNIKVVTTADTSGIDKTSAGFTRLQQQQANWAATQARTLELERARVIAHDKPPPIPPEFGGPGGPRGGGGLTGTAVGLGTIITLLTAGLNKWKEFNAEQDRWVEGMIRAEAKARELGEAILDMQDKARSAARLGTEPL